MKIAAISDIHGNFKALERVLEDIKDTGADSVIVLGDIVFFGEEPQKCFETLREIDPLVWIRGNTDDWFNEIGEDYMSSNEIEAKCYAEFKRICPLIRPETGHYLSALREKQLIEIAGRKMLCVHGSDRKIN
jgi:putative phosphoesterase